MNWKHIYAIALPGLALFSLSAAHWILPDKPYSESERRILAKAPSISVQSLSSGTFMKEAENWSLDQFPLRDEFRTLKAYANLKIFQRMENNGYYLYNGYADKLLYPMNEDKLDIAGEKIAFVYETYLSDTDCNVYFSIVPDKNYFTANAAGFPAIDYDSVAKVMKKAIPFAEYVSIFDTLTLQSYYKTDQHWRQEYLLETAERLGTAMGTQVKEEYEQILADVPFSGTYAQQSALLMPPEDLYYLTSPVLEKCTVTCLDTGDPSPVLLYDLDKAAGRDGYEMFLNGSKAILVIENPSADTDKELILFRDSFGSSLAPLLVPGYSKITLVDLRYINSSFLENFLFFEDQDVLFMYSTLVLSNTIGQ